jgi:arylsulfate sulfotransferase
MEEFGMRTQVPNDKYHFLAITCKALTVFWLLFELAACISCGNITSRWQGRTPTVEVSATQNPLVAQCSIVSPYNATAWVEFGPNVNYGRQTAKYLVSAEKTANILVAGMRPSAAYHMRVHVSNLVTEWICNDQVFETGPLPPIPFPTLEITRPLKSTDSTENFGIEMLNLFDGSGQSHMMQALFADRDGYPIWYYDVGAKQGYTIETIKLLPNGNVILDIYDPVAAATILLREIDLAGNIIREMNRDELVEKIQKAGFRIDRLDILHHDILPLSNGHLILLANCTKHYTNLPSTSEGTKIQGDVLIEIDSEWEPIWTWSAFDHLDFSRSPGGLPDWTHSNAVVYSPRDGNLLLSMRNQAWIVKIDYRDGKGGGDVIWRLGPGGDFDLAGDNPAQWFYFQHFPSIINQTNLQTTLAVFDNGNFRVLDSSGTMCGTRGAAPCYSRAAIFEVNEYDKIATVLWQYLPGVFSVWGGSINQLTNGNIEFNISSPIPPPEPGIMSQVIEVTKSPAPEVIWQMNIRGVSAYRAYRVPSLYPSVTWNY